MAKERFRPVGEERRGFTLTELLTVVAIISVLLGLMLAAVSKARASATRTSCAARLRQLAQGCEMYRQEYRVYPAPLGVPGWGAHFPAAVNSHVRRELGAVFKWEPPTPTDRLSDLPAVLVCPARDQFDLFRDAQVAPGVVWWATGYAYCARLTEPSPNGKAVRPERTARARGGKRAVLWADHVAYIDAGPHSGYQFFHYDGRLDLNPMGLARTPAAIQGQHRAWSDGAVEWIDRSELGLHANPAERSASYKAAVPGAFTFHYFF